MDTSFPKLIRVDEFALRVGVTRDQAYYLIRDMPLGVVVRLRRRIRLNEEKLNKWIEAGGCATKGEVVA